MSQIVNQNNVNKKNLRVGFSTGTAATAAAMAAAALLFNKKPENEVLVRLPGGEDIAIKVFESNLVDEEHARAVVVKDAGDDPDITNGAKIGALVSKAKIKGLEIIGGSGVGKLTKPGLVLPPGEWAINPVPRMMLKENLASYYNNENGLKVEIFVENGEKLAQKTLNPRLGIIGGISILGTTGLVKPFSHKAYTETIEHALSVARSSGLSEVVLTTGGQSEGYAMALRADLPQEAFIQIADFYSEGLRLAAEYGFDRIGLAVFFGKAVKQAAGIPYTHAHNNDLEVKDLLKWLPQLPEKVANDISNALTARAALEILRQEDLLVLVAEVASRVLASARGFSGGKANIWVTIFDYDGSVLARVPA